MRRRLASFFGKTKETTKKNVIDANSQFTHKIPHQLGINPTIPQLITIVEQLEKALDDTYMTLVRQRLISKYNYSNQKYDWMLLELKRFFILTSVMKDVPMYSEDVDVIWHEMILHTRDYEVFCSNYCGHFIHHQPTVTTGEVRSEKANEDQRAMFDLVYSLLFNIYDENKSLVQPFFRYNVNDTLFYDIETFSEGHVIEKYFNRRTRDTFHNVKVDIIENIKNAHRATKKVSGNLALSSLPVTSMLFFTPTAEVPMEEQKQASCSTVAIAACGSGNSKTKSSTDSDSSHKGSDGSSGGSSDGGSSDGSSSSSSCSSCGGGCGSS
ncbi:hypothetical protein [Paenibacillus sp. L3-i20]|uniref:hypothetical protein n=1 Tax=Paenibacillus sp. L3-i20 TaxID=2905833 RepID=UPI001EE12B32|nr:hypothetical protein [Paenibacillus sp. L3-i20]GKU76182.1 hypothetical protein L3i20_v205790 [Paenibacillus sp. L3-i20]